jgi:hypothetical protein
MIDAGNLFDAPEHARSWEAYMLARRRRSKNSGGGIAPAAIGALIEGTFCSVNGFQAAPKRRARAQNADNVLMRLNFRRHPGNGWLRFRVRQI